MYHLINTLHPKNEEKNNALMGFVVMVRLVICGYALIGLLVVITHQQALFNNNCLK